jgi:hypothetical protein
MSRKSQGIIGPNVDIPVTTEFEESLRLGIDGKLVLTKQRSGISRSSQPPGLASSRILTSS